MNVEGWFKAIETFVIANKAWAPPIVLLLAFGESLAFISLVLLAQPLALTWPLVNSFGAIGLALVMMLFLTRYSPLQARKRLFYAVGIAAIASELLWVVCLASHPSLVPHLAIPRLLIWSLFIGLFLLRKVKALMVEPYVTAAVVMGAAAGYLLIGYLDRKSTRLNSSHRT